MRKSSRRERRFWPNENHGMCRGMTSFLEGGAERGKGEEEG